MSSLNDMFYSLNTAIEEDIKLDHLDEDEKKRILGTARTFYKNTCSMYSFADEVSRLGNNIRKYEYVVGLSQKTKKYDKLVRDNIPNIIKSNGEEPITRILNDEEFWEYLLKKDSEELEEVRTASSPEEIKKELGDKLELIISMANYNGYTLEDIIQEAENKKFKNGGFEKRILLERVISNK